MNIETIDEISYKIAEEIRVPDPTDMTKEASLFDFTMDENSENDEGIILAEKIKRFIFTSLLSVLKEQRDEVEGQIGLILTGKDEQITYSQRNGGRMYNPNEYLKKEDVLTSLSSRIEEIEKLLQTNH